MELVWPLRKSFVNYVEMVGGTISTSGDAARGPAGFVFPDGHKTDDGYTFVGSIRFLAHDGLLDLRLSNPQVVLREGKIDSLRMMANGRVAEIASLELVAEGPGSISAAPHLTRFGAQLFQGGYAPGEAFDNLTLFEASRSRW